MYPAAANADANTGVWLRFRDYVSLEIMLVAHYALKALW
jgi:hypothetical protein